MTALRNPYRTPQEDPRYNDEALMKRYAAETLRRPRDGYEIAGELVGTSDPWGRSVSTFCKNYWETHPIVLAERLRLMGEYGEQAELPTKETVLKEVLALARTDKHSVRDRLAAYAQYSEMRGYTGRLAGSQPTLGVFSNRVMLVREFDDFEAAAKAQQSKLIKDAKDDAARNVTHH